MLTGETHEIRSDLDAHLGGRAGEGLALSIRKVTIAPGGAFPSFADPGAPLLTFVSEGAVVVRRSDADASRTIPARSSSEIASGHRAYRRNESDAPAAPYLGVAPPTADLGNAPRTGPLAHGEH